MQSQNEKHFNYKLDVKEKSPFTLKGFSITDNMPRTLEGKLGGLVIDTRNKPRQFIFEIEAHCQPHQPLTLTVSGNGLKITPTLRFDSKHTSKIITIAVCDKHDDETIDVLFESFMSIKAEEIGKVPVLLKSVTLVYDYNDPFVLEERLKEMQLENDALKNELQKLKINQFNEPLLDAVNKGNLNRVEALVVLGAEVNCKNALGQTPLLISLLHDFPYVAQFLVNNEDEPAELTSVDAEGNTIIENLAIAGASKHLQWLIDKHPKDQGVGFLQSAYQKIQDVDSEQYGLVKQILANNMLLIAVKQNKLEHVKSALLEFKADIDVQNSAQETALHKACQFNYADIVNFLLEMGTKTDLVDTYGVTAIGVGGISQECSSLIKHYELLRCINSGNKHGLETRLLSYKDAENNTLEDKSLLIAVCNLPKTICLKMRKEMIELLINYGQNINSIVNGTIALHEAIRTDVDGDNKELIKAIIKFGALKDTKNLAGQTVVEYAFSLERNDLAIYLAERFKAEHCLLKYSSCFFGTERAPTTQVQGASEGNKIDCFS